MACNKLIVLVSCMYQTGTSIIERLKLQTDSIVVNQCDEDARYDYNFVNDQGKVCHVIYINTTERGLSKSRNMAIRNAPNNCICLLCDDDEILTPNYESLILNGYQERPDADLIAHSLNWDGFGKTYPQKRFKLSIIDALRVCSVQITFKSSSVKNHRILFDEMLGSGTGNGAGEENRFMLDCRKSKFNMYYNPSIIATISQGESKWFKGYDKKYFNNFGWSARRVYKNFLLTICIILYSGIKKYPLYKKNFSLFNALKEMLKGMTEKRGDL